MKKHGEEGFHPVSGDELDRNPGRDTVPPAEAPAEGCSYSCEPSTRDELETESNMVQLFVRMISVGETIVMRAEKKDTVEHLHRRIEKRTGIPIIEQRLIYRGKQLQYEQSLGDYSVENDAVLNLVGRMRSTEYPMAWMVINSAITTILQLCRGELLTEDTTRVEDKLNIFFRMIPRNKDKNLENYFKIISSSSTPTALVMLYTSSIEGNTIYAEQSITEFLIRCKDLPITFYYLCIPIMLDISNLLLKVAPNQKLYLASRSFLGSMLESIERLTGLRHKNNGEGSSFIRGIFPIISELADNMVTNLIRSIDSEVRSATLCNDVHEFSIFLIPVKTTITYILGSYVPFALPLQKRGNLDHEIESLYTIFNNLLTTMEKCLDNIEIRDNRLMFASWAEYLAVLKIIDSISGLYRGAKEQVLCVLGSRKASFRALITTFANRLDDHKWIFEYKSVTDFESRRHLIMMMFPVLEDDITELFEMLIDRFDLLSESFEYIGHAEPKKLHSGLFIEFKNELATGPGVLREWFLLVTQTIFDPETALFLPSPVDPRRFCPNPDSSVDPMYQEYFNFSGRVIALSILHRVHVGVLLDRVFFLQLAGKRVSLEDIKDVDLYMYKSCKEILEMDPELIDSDILGLTFVREFEQLGNRSTVELCPGGKSIVVNSKNREKYVELLINSRFVKSISEQVCCFARGFNDILLDPKRHRFSFFEFVDLEDVDLMLRGEESSINVDDWKAHTEYSGYSETDDQILWFWKIVKEMREEQKRKLLFFWTSMKYLPVEGFKGLSSRLYIVKVHESSSPNRLPSSHTCFYRFYLPLYPSLAVSQHFLGLLTQDHVISSFGYS